ncbi:MAG TPA: rhodanese-like domain-containing protein [Bryobacteraceae bacterium]|jgi:rhodanese-related sulfurtransferase
MAARLEIDPLEVKRRLDAGEKIHLIDVREPHEFAQAKIEGAKLIPMRSVPAELPDLENQSEEGALIVYCHHGVRSLNVVHWLREQGIEACQSMTGGIDAWSLLVDPSVPRYN